MWSRLSLAWHVWWRRPISLWVKRIDPDSGLAVEQWINDLYWPYDFTEITLAMDQVRSKQSQGDTDKLRQKIFDTQEEDSAYSQVPTEAPALQQRTIDDLREMTDCAHAKQMRYLSPDATDEEREAHVQQSWKDRQPKKG